MIIMSKTSRAFTNSFIKSVYCFRQKRAIFLYRRGFSDKAMNEFGLLYCPTFIKPRAEYVAYKLVNKTRRAVSGRPYHHTVFLREEHLCFAWKRLSRKGPEI